MKPMTTTADFFRPPAPIRRTGFEPAGASPRPIRSWRVRSRTGRQRIVRAGCACTRAQEFGTRRKNAAVACADETLADADGTALDCCDIYLGKLARPSSDLTTEVGHVARSAAASREIEPAADVAVF